VDADTSADGGTFRSDNELDVLEGLRLRLPLPNDPQYAEKQDKLAELFRHPAVAGKGGVQPGRSAQPASLAGGRDER
jgi:hypothetical protein